MSIKIYEHIIRVLLILLFIFIFFRPILHYIINVWEYSKIMPNINENICWYVMSWDFNKYSQIIRRYNNNHNEKPQWYFCQFFFIYFYSLARSLYGNINIVECVVCVIWGNRLIILFVFFVFYWFFHANGQCRECVDNF